MPDETTAPVEQAVDSEKENLKAELDAMRKKNAELLDETKKAKANWPKTYSLKWEKSLTFSGLSTQKLSRTFCYFCGFRGPRRL